jgi:aconitase A
MVANGAGSAGTDDAANSGAVKNGAVSSDLTITCRALLDSSIETEYFRHGGVLPRVLRSMLG